MRRSTLVISAMFTLALVSVGAAYASVYIFDYSSQALSIQAPSVALGAGSAGSSTISSVAPDAATATVSSAPYPPYVAITLTNSQTSATSAGFQQEITIDPAVYAPFVSGDLGNIRFCSDAACSTQLYSWLEECGSGAPYGACSTTSTSATFWVKLTSSIAGNGGTLTIYMTFLSTSTDFDGIQAGEAPTLSGTYAQFDNGANVFTQYGGKSWSSFTPYEGTWDTTNGYLEQTSSSSLGFSGGGPAALITSTSYPNGGQYVIETAFSYSSQAIARVGIVAVTGLSGSDPVGYRFIGQQSNDGAGFISFLNDLKVWVVSNTYAGSVNTAYTMQVVDNGGTWSGTLFSGYGISGSTLASLAPTAYTAANNAGGTSGYVGVSAAWYSPPSIYGNPAKFQWFRIRAYPPSGVMPSASFATLGAVGQTIVAYVPVTLANSQSGATNNPLQVLINWNPSMYSTYLRSDLGNVRWCADNACATTLFAWLEGCSASCSSNSTTANTWVRLTSSISGGGGTLTIYMVFLSTATGFDGIYWGEAPRLSATYGLYDNGANVFTFYDDFQGTSLSSKWAPSNSGCPAPTVNNGITLLCSTAGGSSAISFATAQSTRNVIVEAAMNVYGSSGTDIRDRVNHGLAGTSVADFGYFYVGTSFNYYFGGSSSTLVPVSSSATSYNILDQQIMTSSGQLSWNSLNYPAYTSIYSNTATFTPGSTFTVGFSATLDPGGGTTSEMQMEFVRIRAEPPSNIMPSVSLGSVTSSYILAITNQASSSWNVNLAVASSSNTGRLTNLTMWFYSPTSVQIRLGTAVTQLTTGPVVTLPGSGTLYVALYASSSASGSSTITLSLKIQLGSTGPYAQYTIYLTVN